MDALACFQARFEECPPIAIIRGVRPDEAVAIGGALYRPGQSAGEVAAQARAFVAALSEDIWP